MARLRVTSAAVVCVLGIALLTASTLRVLAAGGSDNLGEWTVDYVKTGKVSLSGTSPVVARVGHAIEMDLKVTPQFKTDDVTVLWIQGANAWRVLPPPRSEYDIVGDCQFPELVPFLLREQVSKRLYIQVPHLGTCAIRLRLVPRMSGRHTVAFRVYLRNIINVDARHYNHPYAIDRRTKARGPELSWTISVSK